MNDQDFDALSGQLAALSTVLTAVIAALPPVIALQAVASLQSEVDIQHNDTDASPAFAQARDAVTAAYLQLLDSVVSRG